MTETELARAPGALGSRRGGFTLVELLIAMTFALILATIALLSISGIREESYVSTLKSDLRSLATAQELHHQIHLQYGAVPDLQSFESSRGVTISLSHVSGTGWSGSATHAGSLTTCWYYVGDVPPGDTGLATAPGQAFCD